MKNLLYASIMILATLGFTACSDDDDQVKMTTVTLAYEAPANLTNPVISDVTLTLKNLATGRTETIATTSTRTNSSATVSGNNITLTVAEGMYTISLEGNLTYTLNGETKEAKVRAYMENQTLTGSTTSTAPIEVKTYLYTPSETGNGFVIAEIFFSCTLTPEGKQYSGDAYFRIYNNSGDTLYADGLAIAESSFLTNDKQEYDPDIMNEAFTTDALYRIPGSGKDVMVLPGESLLICDIGMDHRTANPQSFDLTKSDFEWYDESTNPDYLDPDTDVPNLERLAQASWTIWTPHMRGCKAYVLAYLGTQEAPLAKEDYLRDYLYTYTYNFVWDGVVYPMGDYEGYKIPNEWIVDAVNVSIVSDHQWLVTSPTLDKGYTYCREDFNDQTSYGQCVRRKVLSGSVLQDTNDSSADFLPKQVADPYYKFHN